MKKTKLFKFEFISQFRDSKIELEVRETTELKAKKEIVKRVNELDKKWLKRKYKLEDFTLISIDETFIEMEKQYQTRDGRKVEIINQKRETNSSFKVEGYIIEKKKTSFGRTKKTWTCWNENGRYTVGTNLKDLVEVA